MNISGSSTPPGTIVLWHGLIAGIPGGWTLCDGSAGTPDLRSSFVRGAPVGAEAGSTGGADSHTLLVDEMPSHSHVLCYGSVSAGGYGISPTAYSGSVPLHSSSCSCAGGGAAFSTVPAYYEALYIMKV